ncbi:hypothetical protein F5Y13DRAFT_17538 [Hypoxylon sp. FL1857]|nr:hypothetical protein F5Y13DRAFT_17538 [Hypoxylon sp. FL1857]
MLLVEGKGVFVLPLYLLPFPYLLRGNEVYQRHHSTCITFIVVELASPLILSKSTPNPCPRVKANYSSEASLIVSIHRAAAVCLISLQIYIFIFVFVFVSPSPFPHASVVVIIQIRVSNASKIQDRTGRDKKTRNCEKGREGTGLSLSPSQCNLYVPNTNAMQACVRPTVKGKKRVGES